MTSKPTRREKGEAQTACAFVFESGEAHQVLIAGSELLDLLASYFKAKGTAIRVYENVSETLAIGDPEPLPLQK